MQPPMQQQPPAQPKPKKNMMIIAIIAIVVVIAVVLVAVLLMSGAGTSVNNSTADSAARAFYDATNKYNAKDMLELSVYHFANSFSRGTEWAVLNATTYAYDLANAKLTISSVTVENQVQMSSNEQNVAESTIDNLIYIGITEEVVDYSLVTVSYTYSVLGFPLSETASALMFKIQGKWYVESPLELLY